MKAKEEKNNIQCIHERKDGNTSYLLHPEDNDLFVRTGRQVIASCQLGISLELWLNELSSMMKAVHDWANVHAGHVRACYCAPQGTSVVFFFAPKSEQFDFDLADELAAFNLELLRTYNVGMAEMRQIPWSEFDRFVNPTAATNRLIYGEQLKPLEAVDA